MFKYCRSCGTEFLMSASRCPDCDVALDLSPGERLEAPAAPEVPAAEDLALVRVGVPHELQDFAEELQAHGISSRIDTHPPGGSISGPRSYRGRVPKDAATQLGIYVHGSELATARDLVDALVVRSLPADETDAALHDATACPACGEPTPDNAAECASCGLEFPEIQVDETDAR